MFAPSLGTEFAVMGVVHFFYFNENTESCHGEDGLGRFCEHHRGDPGALGSCLGSHPPAEQGGLFQDAVEIYHQRCVIRPKDIFHTLYLRFQRFSESLKTDRGDSSGLSPSTEVRKTLTFRPHQKRKQRGMVQNRNRQRLCSCSP